MFVQFNYRFGIIVDYMVDDFFAVLNIKDKRDK